MKINAIPRKILIKSGFMFTSVKQVIKKNECVALQTLLEILVTVPKTPDL